MGILWNTKKALKTCEFFFILGLLFQGWRHTMDPPCWQRLETLLVRKVNCIWFLHPHKPNFQKRILKHYQRHSNNFPTLLRDFWSSMLWWLLKVAEYSCSVKSQLLVASWYSLLLISMQVRTQMWYLALFTKQTILGGNWIQFFILMVAEQVPVVWNCESWVWY